MSGSKIKPIRVGSLDSLRGVAILLVILAHTAAHFDDSALFRTASAVVGNLGVQLFFIVSAYTMCMMWHGREAEHRRLEKFYIRRICRIAVPYWSAILLYGFVLGFHPAGLTFWGVASNFTFLHGFSPTYNNTVVPGGWSIADEVNFYVIFPILIKFNPIQVTAMAIFWYFLMGLGLSSYLLNQQVDGNFVYYSLLTQMPVFLIGIASYELGRTNRNGDNKTLLITSLMAAAWIASAFELKNYGYTARPVFWMEIIGMAFGVWLVVRLSASLRVLSFVGQRSYSMYLLHFCALWLLFRYAPAHLPWIIGFVATVLLSVLFASIGQKTVESWGQALGKWLIARLPAQVEMPARALDRWNESAARE